MTLQFTDSHTPSMICSAAINGRKKVCVTLISYIGACIPVCSAVWLKKWKHCRLQHQLYNKFCTVCYIHYHGTILYRVHVAIASYPGRMGGDCLLSHGLGTRVMYQSQMVSACLIDIWTQSSSWQCDQPWNSSSCLVPRPTHYVAFGLYLGLH